MFYNYLFTDEETGEDFIVYERTIEKAKEVAKEYFNEPKYCDKLTDYEAEVLGYDTY